MPSKACCCAFINANEACGSIVASIAGIPAKAGGGNGIFLFCPLSPRGRVGAIIYLTLRECDKEGDEEEEEDEEDDEYDDDDDEDE